MGALREKMEREIQLRRFSPKTKQAYTSAVYGLAKYYNKSPDRISNEEVQEYILYLIGRGPPGVLATLPYVASNSFIRTQSKDHQ